MEQILVKTEFIEKSLPVVLVELGGYIDQNNCDKLQKIFDNLFTSEHFYVIFDLIKLTYMSSAGWGIFVGEVKRFRENGGDIKIVNMNSEIYEVFQMLEFYHIIEDYNSIEEALSAYGVELEAPKSEEKGMDMDIEEIVKTMQPQNGDKDEDTTFFEEGNKLFEQTPPAIKDVKKQVDVSAKKKMVDLRRSSAPEEKEPIPTPPKPAPSFELDITQFPIQEKIRKIISQFPLVSVRQMKKMLKHDDFGREKVSLFRLYRILKSLELNTKVKRYRFYRSC